MHIHRLQQFYCKIHELKGYDVSFKPERMNMDKNTKGTDKKI